MDLPLFGVDDRSSEDPGAESPSERRHGDRRAGERRAFRREGGRRAERPRRRSERKLGGRMLALALLAIVAFGARASCVAPRRAAETTARLVEPTVDLQALLPAGVVVPGLGMPTAEPPALPTGFDPTTYAEALGRLEASRGSEQVPRVLQLLGPLRFALGDLPAARRAWQELEVRGVVDQQAAARVGQAAVAIVTAVRPGLPEQDRAFTLEHALAKLKGLDADGPSGKQAAANRAVALALLQRDETAERAAAQAGSAYAPLVVAAQAFEFAELPEVAVDAESESEAPEIRADAESPSEAPEVRTDAASPADAPPGD